MKSLLFALLVINASAQGAAAQSWGPWNVDWGEQYCSLGRQTSGDKPIIFALRTIPGSRNSELWLVNSAWSASDVAKPDSIKIVLKPANTVVPKPVTPGKLESGRALVTYMLPDDFRGELVRTTSISVMREGKSLLELPLSVTPKALAAWRECERSVLRDWGVDPDAHYRIRTPPIGNPGEVISADDYPEAALRASASGTVTALVEVGADGRPTDCKAVGSSGHPSLDSRTCEILLRRARFEPAIGPDGSAVRASIVQRITWRTS